MDPPPLKSFQVGSSGQHDFDPIAYELERLRTYLFWIEEHRASFEAGRQSNPEQAESELAKLTHSTESARKHMEQLVTLLLAGGAIDRTKRLPPDLLRRREAGNPNP